MKYKDNQSLAPGEVYYESEPKLIGKMPIRDEVEIISECASSPFKFGTIMSEMIFYKRKRRYMICA